MKKLLVLAMFFSLMGVVPANAESSYVGTPSPVTELKVLRVESDGFLNFKVRLQWEAPENNGSKVIRNEIFAREVPRVFESETISNFPWRLIHSSNSAATDLTFELPFWARNKPIEITIVSHNQFGPSHEPNARFVSVAMAKASSCSVTETGNIYCWGTSEGFGELGDSASGFLYPRKIMGVPKASDIAAGDVHYCALSSGDVYCWGRNLNGEVTGSPGGSFETGQKVALPSRAIDVMVGESHSCALLETEDLWCWGSDEYSQLAGAGPEPSMIYGAPIVKARAGGIMTCVLDDAGGVFCTGVANNDFFDFSQEIPFSSPATDIAVGQHATCAVVATGVECFGFGENGEIGVEYSSSSTPRFVPDSQGLEEIFTKRFSVCGLDKTREVRCWGNSWVSTKAWNSVSRGQYQSEFRPALVKAVELQNRSQPKLYYQDMGPSTGPFTNDGSYDEIANWDPTVAVLQDPIMLAPGEHGLCGIDSFGGLWCSSAGPPEAPTVDVISNEDTLLDSSGKYLGREFKADSSKVTQLYQHFLTLPRFRVDMGRYYGSGTSYPDMTDLRTVLGGKNEVGGTLSASLVGFVSKSATVEYVWYRGTGNFERGNFAQFEIIGLAKSRTYKVTEEDRNKTIGVVALVTSDLYSYETKAEAFLLSGQGQEQANPFGWTKRLSGSQAKLYAKDIIGAGKVSFRLNGKEVAWVNALDSSDRKLRLAGGSNYLVRTVNLVPGKNVLEVFIAGERVKRVVYSR